MVLYVDTFLAEAPLHVSRTAFSPIIEILDSIRSSKSVYCSQKKDEIFKYSLLSYSVYNWDEIHINVDSEEKEYVENVLSYAKKVMPGVLAKPSRSANKNEWLQNISEISGANPWVFFSPNNDHPIINALLTDFEGYSAIAEKFEDMYPNHIVSIAYSHFPELWNSIKKGQNLYGYTHVIPEVIFENDLAFVVAYDQTPMDSLFIHRKKNLLRFFESAASGVRIVRLEDISPDIKFPQKNIVVIPKLEICRHYDGYVHTVSAGKQRFISQNAVPVLFIPEGIFAEELKIRYGFDDHKEGYLNINPRKEKYSFEDNIHGADLKCYLNEIPFFWHQKIEIIERSGTLQDKGTSLATRLLYNPWLQNNAIGNLYNRFVNYYRVSALSQLLKKLWNFIYYRILRKA